jgi:transposase
VTPGVAGDRRRRVQLLQSAARWSDVKTSTMLGDTATVRLIRLSSGRSRCASCPHCHRNSERVHSCYTRRVADLPWQGVSVRLELHALRFRCQNSLCPQRIFCERLPRVVAHYGRKTVRLNAALELIGFALGREAGARLARELGLIVSPDTLLRRLRRCSQEEPSTPHIIGVDDFAFRRGRRPSRQHFVFDRPK